MSAVTPLHELAARCLGGARGGGDADRVDGVAAALVAYPGSTREVAGALEVAAAHGLPVVVRGAGTKQDWGGPPERVGVVLDLSHMSGVVEHVSDDLVVRVRAGTRLADLAGALASARQRLPLDEVVPGSTVGGVVATGISGPLRYGHGAVRDRLLGVTVVRADGIVARAGSKVVKNVAGYDLSKLFTGSYGTLGVLTELTFKLDPQPEARLFVTSSYPGPEQAAPALATLLRTQAGPAAIELYRPLPDGPLELCALLEGSAGAIGRRAAEVSAGLSVGVAAGPGAGPGPVGEVAAGGGPSVPSEVAPSWWGQLPGPVTVKLTAVLSAVPALVASASAACSAVGLRAPLGGSAGAGVLYVGLPETVRKESLAHLLAELRRAASTAEGHATLLRAPAGLKDGLDLWGPVPGLELMRRVKASFDSGRLLAPGRFVGGI